MTIYRDRREAGMYDPDEKVREKAARKIDRQFAAMRKEVQESAVAEAEAEVKAVKKGA